MDNRMRGRRFDLDWLRIIAFGLLMLFHTGMMFVSWGWHIKNAETSVVFEFLMRFLHEWRMPLLFFISGAAVWFALQKYSLPRFLRERCVRLLVPLIFGMLVVIPPQVYFERLFQGWAYASFWEFYLTIFTSGSYPQGNMSWHHLWYIPYIFSYSLLLPLLWMLRTQGGRQQLGRLRKALSRPGALLLLVVPSAISDLCLRPYWPGDTNNLTSDWANFCSKAVIFLIGFILCSGEEVWHRIERDRLRYLFLALFTFCLLCICWYSDWEIQGLARQAYRTLRDLDMWCWLLAVLGFGWRYLNRNHPFLNYATEAVYPWYVLHQTVIVVIAYYIAPWDLGLYWKYIFLLVSMAVITGLLYEFLIRRIPLLRPLFGLKIKMSKGRRELLLPNLTPPEER